MTVNPSFGLRILSAKRKSKLIPRFICKYLYLATLRNKYTDRTLLSAGRLRIAEEDSPFHQTDTNLIANTLYQWLRIKVDLRGAIVLAIGQC